MAKRQIALGKDSHILMLDNPGATDDGLNVVFEIVTDSEDRYPFWLREGEEIAKFITFLIDASQYGASKRKGPRVRASLDRKNYPPIEGAAIRIQRGRSAGEFVLWIDLGSFSLHFALPARDIPILRQALNDMDSDHPGDATQ